MQAVYLRKKVFNLIADFESGLKKMVAQRIKDKYNIELTNPLLYKYYPTLILSKFTEGFAIDLSMLWGIVKADLNEVYKGSSNYSSRVNRHVDD